MMKRRSLTAVVLAAAFLLPSCSSLRSVDRSRTEDDRAGQTEQTEQTEQTVGSVQTEPVEETAVTETHAQESSVTEATETSAEQITDETREEGSAADPHDGQPQTYDDAARQGEPLSDEEQSQFFASYADTYYMSSGVGGWGVIFTLNADGSFDYNYHDSDFGTYYICHASGTLGNVCSVDDMSYTVFVADMSYEYRVDSEWTVTDTDGSTIEYVGADSYGIHEGDTLTFYSAGMDVSGLPFDYVTWYLMPRAIPEGEEPDVFPLSGFYNPAEGTAFIEDDYE